MRSEVRISAIIVLSTFFLFILVAMLIYSLSFMNASKRGDEKDEVFEYNYLQYDKNLNKITTGISSISQELGRDEYISYNNHEDGSHHLISHLEAKQYVCRGSCYCEVDENEYSDRRMMSPPSNNFFYSRGMLYLVAAASSTLAMKEAKTWIGNVCRDEYEPGRIIDIPCPPENFMSEVDECQEFEDIVPLESERRKYWCKGKCIRKVFGIEKIELMSQKFECDKLIRKGQVEVTHLKKKEDVIDIARRTFQNLFLDPYCEKESKVTAFFNSPHEHEPDTILYHTVGLCRGKTEEMPENPTVICVQTYPETKTTHMIEEEMASLSEQYRDEYDEEKEKRINALSAGEDEEEEEEYYYEELEKEYFAEADRKKKEKPHFDYDNSLTIDYEEETVVEVEKYEGDK